VRLVDNALERLHGAHESLTQRRWDAGRGDRRVATWPEAAKRTKLLGAKVTCNLCGWRGVAFDGVEHCESALCPVCGSIARDRFLYFCWTERVPYDPQAFVLETSPRLDEHYRARMAERVRYTSSDYELGAHKGAIQLDMQAMDLPDDTVDVVLTPHVLEHVPDTDKALAELFRTLKPGGSVLLQVPVPQATTIVPPEPEYHGDMTLVFWRFGWDLADRFAQHGFTCDTLVTQELFDRVVAGQSYDYRGADCDVDSLMAGADASRLTVVATTEQAARHGFRPAFQFITFHARKPA
jgi:SAM-dependent methyltransferase